MRFRTFDLRVAPRGCGVAWDPTLNDIFLLSLRMGKSPRREIVIKKTIECNEFIKGSVRQRTKLLKYSKKITEYFYGEKESHIETPQGQKESHIDTPQGQKESHIDTPQGQKESHIDTPQGQKESHIDTPQGQKESHIDTPQGQKESHIDTPQGQKDKRHMNLMLCLLCDEYLPSSPKTILCLDDIRLNSSKTFLHMNDMYLLNSENEELPVIHSPNTDNEVCKVAAERGIISENCDVHDYLAKTDKKFNLMYLDYTATSKYLLKHIDLIISKINDTGILALTYSYRKGVFKMRDFQCKQLYMMPEREGMSTTPSATMSRTNSVIIDRVNKANRNAKFLVARLYGYVYTLIYLIQ
jgi:hypothetical protein